MVLWAEMYLPVDWSNFMNEEYPQIVQIVTGEEPSNTSRAFRKRSNDLNPLNRRKPWVRCHIFVSAALIRLGTCRLVKRSYESNDSPSYTTSAIYCADSVDPQGTTMEDVFRGIISTTRNVSHMCEFP